MATELVYPLLTQKRSQSGRRRPPQGTTGILGSFTETGLIEVRDGYELTLSLGEGEGKGKGGNQDLRLDITAIPEPSTVVITLAGLAALAALKRSRKSA